MPAETFDWITPDLAVGACPPADGWAALAAQGIGAVVDLREEDRDDEAAVRAAGLDFLHLPTPDLHPPSPAHLDAGVAFVRDELATGRKVLIHCQHGIGRSALLALCVLSDAGMAPLEALTRAKDARERISPSPSQYEGWAAWLAARGLQAPDAHTFGCIAYRHLARA